MAMAYKRRVRLHAFVHTPCLGARCGQERLHDCSSTDTARQSHGVSRSNRSHRHARVCCNGRVPRALAAALMMPAPLVHSRVPIAPLLMFPLDKCCCSCFPSTSATTHSVNPRGMGIHHHMRPHPPCISIKRRTPTFYCLNTPDPGQ